MMKKTLGEMTCRERLAIGLALAAVPILVCVVGPRLQACSTPEPRRSVVASFSGDRPEVTDPFRLEAGTAELVWTYSGPEWSWFDVTLLDARGQWGGNPVFENVEDAGEISGRSEFRVSEAGEYTLLVDQASGKWRIVVKQ